MAPVRKTKGVNKRFPYINEVASNKYGDNPNKNKQKKRKLSAMLGPQWTTEELKHFYEGYRKYGKDWMKVASVVRHRSLENVEALYTMNRAYLSLPEGTASVIGLTAMMCDYYSMLERSDSEQNCIDNAGTPRKPQKLARGKLRNDASKGLEGHILDISQSRSIASDGCLSLLKNRRTDEDSSFDALLTLADLSLRMPEATAEMESSALVEEENFNIAKKSKLKGNSSITMVEDTALKTSQLGKLKEGVQQSDTGIQKRKQKSPVKINENEAQTEFPWSDNQMIEILKSSFDSRILQLWIRRNKMARPKFKIISSSSEEFREDTQSQESLDEETPTSFQKTLQHEMTKIKHRKKKQAEDTDDEETAEEETEDEDEDETTSRYCVKTRSQKRKTTDDEDEEYDQKEKKKRKVQLPKTKEQKAKKHGRKKKEEKEETEKKEENIAKVDCRQQKCTLSAFWRLIDAHKSRIPAATWEILRHTVFWGMIEPFLERKLTENQLHKHEADLEIIMRYFDKKKNKFIFGEKEMEITVQDVKTLFDLPTEGIYMELNKKLSKEERKESAIFDTNVKKDSVLKTEVEKKLVKELTKEKKEKDLKKQQDPKKIASLIIMYLFAAFFFSRTATNITWDLISVCEDIDNINKFNWSRMIIDFLLDGIQKYQKDKPTTLSGCLLLIYYWFLEKTKIKNWIPGKETETPRFVRWSIKEIFNLQEVYKNPGWPERLIKDGPWLEKEWLEELEFEEKIEEQETLSFNNWVPQASQREEEEIIRLTGNMRVIIEELETVLREEPTRENMEEKLKRLAEGNEQLSKKKKKMWTKLKIADEMIESMEKKKHDLLLETRANKNQIAALYKLLAKAKHSGNVDDAGASQQKESQLQIVQITTEEEQVGQAEFEDNRS
ncbi:uncharacterized protein LOC133708104 isoform X2 [Rosa rugosa]|uniref:uncharacterized protein LOC133708104 isoform X2 n=1 Tax=Rosa rugosa TaxID=74645 RepID=UPI002B415467|nr:uncharacterized protein LOC133708104 isoform X2 [Rosa rugosa]